MKIITTKNFIILLIIAFIFIIGGFALPASAADGIIDPAKRYAWSENAGWIDFGAEQGDVHITDTALTGYAYGENIGWISLNCSNNDTCDTGVNYGVLNDGEGTLSGYAWSENAGWIDFAPVEGGVTINSSGEFLGYAYGENIGWIVFNCATTNSCGDGGVDYKVATDWRSQSDMDNARTVENPTPEKMAAEVAAGYISFTGADPEDPTQVDSFTFNVDFTLIVGDFSVFFPAGTVVTQTGGGTIDLTAFTTENNTIEIKNQNGDIISSVQIGIPNIRLTFSEDITVTIPVGTTYNGQTLDIFYQIDGDTDWNEENTCLVENGNCTFQTNHATTFGTKEQPEDANITSWKATTYENPNTSCKQKLKLNIQGKHFDKNSEVKIGNTKATSVDKKSSKELTAKFCLTKLLNVKTDLDRSISVTNPDADTKKAKKKIDLGNILNTTTTTTTITNNTNSEYTKTIQRKLVELNLLDSQYITGFYGPLTTEAVKKFQEQNGIEQTGTVGPITKGKLGV